MVLFDYETLVQGDSMDRLHLDKFRVWGERNLSYLICNNPMQNPRASIENVGLDKFKGFINFDGNSWHFNDDEGFSTLPFKTDILAYIRNGKSYNGPIVYVTTNDLDPLAIIAKEDKNCHVMVVHNPSETIRVLGMEN